jgi:hypothetical protein
MDDASQARGLSKRFRSALLFTGMGVGIALALPSAAMAACDCGSKNPAQPCTGGAVTYTSEQSSIGFEFQCEGGACRCGRFANEHDYWVAPARDGGVITITRMTPDQKGAGASLVNGAVADPKDSGSRQGWNGSQEYDASLTLKVPYRVDTAAVKRPVVVMKARSNPNNVAGNNKCNDQRMCLDHVEALTVLSTPPGDVFRPPYFGTEKPLIPLSRLDTSILPALAPTGSEVSYARALASITSVPVDHIWTWTVREHFHPRINYGGPKSGYDGYVAQAELGAYLKMLTRPVNASEVSQRELLVRRVAQRGIDYYHIFKNGGAEKHSNCGGWFGTGGYGTGKLPPILISTALLRQQDTWGAHIRSVLSSTEGQQCFSETSLIQPPNPSGKNVPLFGHRTTSVYTVGRGSKTAADPAGRIDGGGNTASACVPSYQACCTTAIYRGGAVAMWLIPNVMKVFPPGAKHWLDWVDRITSQGGAYCNASSFAVTRYSEGYKVPGADEMYRAYRACSKNYSCQGMSSGGGTGGGTGAGQPPRPTAPPAPPVLLEAVPAGN